MPGFNNLIPESRAPIPSHAFFDASGSGSTVSLEAQDQNSMTLPIVDAAGAVWPYVVVSVPANHAVGLIYVIKNTAPDSTNKIVRLPAGTQRVVARVLTGTISVNSCGTLDGSVGADTGNSNNGILTAGMAPAANSPITHVAGEGFSLGRAME